MNNNNGNSKNESPNINNHNNNGKNKSPGKESWDLCHTKFSTGPDLLASASACWAALSGEFRV